ENYYRHARDNDLCLTHTLINPQANRSVGPSQQKDPFLAARVVEEKDDGIVVRGARMLATLGPIADEVEVFPSTVVKADPADAPYAFGFVIPCSTPGLKFICRETYDLNRSKHDHPLGSRFEEMDARSEEHTSELQSRENLVCRLLLEKKNKQEQKKNT